jgi:hypothetical protein
MCNRRATEPNNTSRIVVISDFKCDAFVFEPEKPTTVATLLLPDSAKATSRARVHLTTSRAQRFVATMTRRAPATTPPLTYVPRIQPTASMATKTRAAGNHATAAHAEAFRKYGTRTRARSASGVAGALDERASPMSGSYDQRDDAFARTSIRWLVTAFASRACRRPWVRRSKQSRIASGIKRVRGEYMCLSP